MATDTNLTRDGHIVAKPCAASESDERNDHAMLTQHDIVTDLNQVVDLCTFTNPGSSKTSAINGGTGANFNIVIDLNNPNLIDFLMASFVKLITKTIRTNSTATVNDDTITEHTALADRCIWVDDTITTDTSSVADEHSRLNQRSFADLDMIFNHHARADTDFLRIK